MSERPKYASIKGKDLRPASLELEPATALEAQVPVLELRCLSAAQLATLEIEPGGFVNIRRDLYQFITYVQQHGLTRSVRGNEIPKTAARKLAKLVSFTGELEQVEEHGCGVWSDDLSRIALEMCLVHFDTQGSYAGESSQERTYPDNAVTVDEVAWRAYLGKTPRAKEQAILEAIIQMTPNEFFEYAFLRSLSRFESFGSATGPVSRMDLPLIRRELLKMLRLLEPGRWYETSDFVDRLQRTHPNLIIDRSQLGPDVDSQRRLNLWTYECERTKRSRQPLPPRPAVTLEDPYVNFLEFSPGEGAYTPRGKALPPISSRLDACQRVEGRYLEFFLAGIPNLVGFVDLAWRPDDDPHGVDVLPRFQRLRAFRVTPRILQVMGQVMGDDSSFDRVQVTVMPNFEVLIDAPSYPDVVLSSLAPYTARIQEDGPLHRLRLERRKVVETQAASPAARPLVELLTEISSRPIPGNVAAELNAWSGQAEKLTLYEGCGLLELKGDAATRARIRKELDALVMDDRLEGFLLVRDPKRAREQLETEGHVPTLVTHAETALSPIGQRAESPVKATSRKKGEAPPGPVRREPVHVRIETEDLVGYRALHPPLLKALHQALQGKAPTCTLVGEDLLVLSAASIPALRAAVRRLSEAFDVEF